MSDWLEAIPAADVPEGEMRPATVDGHLLLVAHVGGEYYITDGHCPHLHGNLTKGTLEGNVVTCPLHGSQFNVTDGSVVRWTSWSGAVKSMAELVRHARPVRAYEVKIEDGTVWVGPQKPAPAAE